MRVAVIGCGSIGKRHLANLCAGGHGAVAIDDSRAVRRWADEQGYASAQELAGRFDAAIIATPAASHLEWIETGIVNDIPVLIEKPLGVLADLPALRALRPTVPVMVGYNWRFHPAVVAFSRESLRESAWMDLMCGTDLRTWPGSAGRGDPLLECSHELDLLQYWRGTMPKLVKTKRGVAQLEYTFASGDHVFVTWQHQTSNRYYTAMSHTGEYQRLTPSSQADLDQSYMDELAHFLHAVDGGPIAPGCTLEEGIAVLDVIAQVQTYDCSRAS